MNHFDTRTSYALMTSRLEEAKKASQRQALAFTILPVIRERLGAWMVARGAKLLKEAPKIA